MCLVLASLATSRLGEMSKVLDGLPSGAVFPFRSPHVLTGTLEMFYLGGQTHQMQESRSA